MPNKICKHAMTGCPNLDSCNFQHPVALVEPSAVEPSAAVEPTNEIKSPSELPFIGGHCLQQCRGDEDRFIVHKITRNVYLFAVLDGHSIRLPYVAYPPSNVKHAINVMQQEFGLFLQKTFADVNYENESDMKQRLHNAFLDFDLKMYSDGVLYGTTCNLVLIDFERQIIYNANIGDSRMFLVSSNKEIVFVSKDHNGMNLNEVKRVKSVEVETNITISHDRVCLPTGEMLAITRAFGDFVYKKTKAKAYDGVKGAVCAVPEITVLHCDFNEETTIILSTDAPFGKMTSDRFIECYHTFLQEDFRTHAQYKQIAEQMCALIRKETHTNDDMTILIVRPLQTQKHPSQTQKAKKT